MGNRELLAVKLALEEWRHWLEGAEHPFIIWTDHKNLAYIQDAKRLNSWQTRWQLFFNRFQFSLTYRPGSCNQKPDALSRQHAIEDVLEAPEGIIPKERIIAVVSWEIERQIQEALKEDPDPGTGSQHRRYIHGSVRPQVMQWGHSSWMACHPSGGRTLGLLRRSFWWPTMERDMRKFVAGCAIYTAMVLHHAGLCHRTSGITGIHHDTHPSGQVLQSGTFCSTYQTPISHGDRITISRTCALWGLASVLSGHRGKS